MENETLSNRKAGYCLQRPSSLKISIVIRILCQPEQRVRHAQIVHADQRNAALFIGHEQKLVARLNAEQFACTLWDDALPFLADLAQTDAMKISPFYKKLYSV